MHGKARDWGPLGVIKIECDDSIFKEENDWDCHDSSEQNVDDGSTFQGPKIDSVQGGEDTLWSDTSSIDVAPKPRSKSKGGKAKRGKKRGGRAPNQKTEQPKSGANQHDLGSSPAAKRPKCVSCGKAFATAPLLLLHRKAWHRDQHAFQCIECDKCFRSCSQINTHMKSHSAERPYLCSHCPAAFRRQNALVYHERTHSGEKPFRCQVCDAAFTSSSNLKQHVKVHSKDRPYACSACPRRFSDTTFLRSHALTHDQKMSPVRFERNIDALS